MQLYSGSDLVIYFFIYAFLGWCAEVGFFAVTEQRFMNRGILNAPICISYGFIMDILIFMTADRGTAPFAFQFLMCFVVVNTVLYLAGHMAARFMRKPLWKYSDVSVFGGRLKSLLISLAAASAFFVALKLLHPLVFLAVSLLSVRLIHVLAVVLSCLLVLDLGSMIYLRNRLRDRMASPGLMRLQNELQEQKQTIGNRICSVLWKRLTRAYPQLTGTEGPAEEAENLTFAKGLSLDKIFWVFLITALLGDLTETLYVHGVSHVWMRRSSLVFGPFSVVWGVGAAILTVVLQRLAGRQDRYIFLGGFFLGGTYEYMCSVFTEAVFGTVFWDYSSMPFNIGGRTNLLFMLFWGILSLIWVKICYPRLSALIERIPAVPGKIATWILVFLMASDMLITTAVMVRFSVRQQNPAAGNAVEAFIDSNYPDAAVHRLWPNLTTVKK